MSTLTSAISGVPRTMLITLRGRADEQSASKPIIEDPLAVEWYKSLPRDEELDKLYNPISQKSLAVRAYHYDNIVKRHIANNSQPIVVELGSGLSTRYYRVGKEVDFWFDLDLPLVIELRQQLETETQQHQLIGCSVMDFSWMGTIPNVEPENILFIAEGLVMYFDVAEVQELFDQMCLRFPGATLAVDVLNEVNKVGKRLGKRNADKLAKLGAPFKWFSKGEKEVAAMGLSIINTCCFYRDYRQHWSLLVRLLSWLTPLGDIYLIFETKLDNK